MGGCGERAETGEQVVTTDRGDHESMAERKGSKRDERLDGGEQGARGMRRGQKTKERRPRVVRAEVKAKREEKAASSKREQEESKGIQGRRKHRNQGLGCKKQGKREKSLGVDG